MAMRGAAMAVRVFDRLAVRLALLLSVALLPLGVLAVVTSLDNRRNDIRSAERSLVSLTADSAGGYRALITSAFTTARTLGGPTLERLDQTEACRALLAETVQQAGVYTFAGFTDTDGWMHCLSNGESLDFSASQIFQQIMADPRPILRRSEAGAVSGQPVLIATVPVSENGTLRGFLSVAMSPDATQRLGGAGDDARDMQQILFNRLGDVLISDAGDDPAELLPDGLSLPALAAGGNNAFMGTTQAGDRAGFAVAELVNGQLYALGVWDPASAPAARLGADPGAVAFPLVMWLASIGVVYFALYYLVIRHLRRLGRQMRRFALGDRTLPEATAPRMSQELRDVHATFRKMAILIARDEAELSAALAEKESALRERTVLLKEVHHRVKNNLQLIASILNLQMRRLRDPRSRRVLQNVQDRVIGLATIHRSLYQTEHLSDLRADLVTENLLRHLFAVGTDGGSGIDIHTDLEPVALPADQLVPLSLLLTEAVTNALKYLGAPEDRGRPWLRIALRREGDEVVLSIINSLGPGQLQTSESTGSSGDGLGSELIEAFAMQMDARLEHGRVTDHAQPCWQIVLRFGVASADAIDDPSAAAHTPMPAAREAVK